MTISNKQFASFVGIDWASDKHDACIQLRDSSREFVVLDSSPESIDNWLSELHKRSKGPIAVALELTKGPIVYALQKYDFVTLFPINPAMLARYRKAFSPSGAKDDPTDAELALDLMLKYPDKIKPLKPNSQSVRKLAFLVEQRRRLVEDKKRLSNRLINTLKQYYPQPLSWFSHRSTELFCEFLIRFPTLQRLKRSKPDTIRKFFQRRPGRQGALTEERIEAIKASIPLTEDPSILESHALLTAAICNQLLAVIISIRSFDNEIASLFDSMADAEIFRSLPGTGPCLAPRLLVAFGEDRSRYNSAAELQKYAGVAPVVERSGKKVWIHWRWQCSKFIRQTFVEWAEKTVRVSYWAGLYYQQRRAKGASHNTAVRALAFKWIRIIYRCWKTKTPYNESKYLKSLKAKNSPLLA